MQSWSSDTVGNKTYFGLINACCILIISLEANIWYDFLSLALFLVIGLVLYPAGWGNDIVDELCTRKNVQKPGAFVLNDCSLGWAFYAVLGGTLSSFLCSLLSAQAEKSTSTDEVQDEISDGKTVICLI